MFQRIERLRRLAWLLDAAIRLPGTKIRLGADSVVGLLPGGGSLLMAAVSLYFVWEAWRLRAPRNVLAQMVFNIVVEGVLDVVPVLGDIADIAFKANLRNVRLLEDHFGMPHRP
ncbi:DUF4112 domain-containing protein [Acetobacter sp. LMG 1627]|uniref:DUF4112 domain-containing protein n=2 Tax=Acetobacter conturbans TaxID=1737472 RepID=A0ABX0JX71_9PROT|nr:DUF4112 domain-containing protein [Acetobacter conturbans]